MSLKKISSKTINIIKEIKDCIVIGVILFIVGFGAGVLTVLFLDMIVKPMILVNAHGQSEEEGEREERQISQ